ncbi:DUF2147 domain-containing protein [Gilvimarinus agarilyticus]|uniref:DUF2147 domain-containing protein n=1 Tax=Gilvimarinus sp. 2_MG-2023 TaxID=3062666 RepID=UPI001C08E583|nr:DUF2147 domain-containing protein [Gilvimarinus sp. 2_MG-2023]MBU2884782.1 DUF2147 domain-containing protein [Gilvimarinus agarilyticus]MDO6569832.1 DUF2147 domain-containing protein [Gilvimarinus sp. 2_MG-2023]
MKHVYRPLLALLAYCLAAPLLAATIEGTWITIDDADGSQKSLIELTLTPEKELTGTITQLLQEKNQGLVCEKCPDKFKDQPVEGLTIMWGLKQTDKGEWRNGKILDPKTGKVYKARAELSENGTELTVRGYIGFSLFGRSQIWQRK